jgi:Maltose-binding periplasmic proteins/domains
MKKKFLALLLVTTVMVASLSGCGSKAGEKSSNSAESSESSTTSAKDDSNGAGDITEVIWQYPTTIDTNSEGFQNMENALNKMMEKDIGVHVTFEPVNLMNSQNDAVLKVSAGEQLDVMLNAFTSVGNVVDKGLVVPLDDYLNEYGQDILAHSHTADMCSYEGQIYGITTGDVIGNQYGYMIKKQYWDKYNLAELTGYSEDKVYTMDEIDKIFEIVKKGEGANFYCDVPWNTTAEPMNNGYMEYDKLGGSLASGVLMLNRSFTDTTIYNLFETPEYAKYCDLKYKWAQKGYIAPDAAVTTESPDSIVAQDNYLGVFYWGAPQKLITYDKTIGSDLVCLNIVPRYMAYNGGSVIQWSVPITSKNPQKAVEAINYIYKNPEAAWIIEFGLEGEDYKVVDTQGDLKQIEFLAKDLQSLPYYMPYGIWGNTLQWPAVAPAPINQGELKQALDDAVPDSRKSPALGYSFNQEPVATEIAAVNTVINQYTPSLNCGALDPNKALPEFISDLKDAGMDKIIAEQQSQFNAWLASKK